MKRYYTYKVTFPGFKWFYYGYHRDNGKPYFGSPVTHKWIWDFYECEVQILEWFASAEEAQIVEKRLIRPCLNNPYCLNENCGGNVSDEARVRGSKKAIQLCIEHNRNSSPEAKFKRAQIAGLVGGKLPWWNNGIKNARSLNCPGEGWVQGRLVAWKWFNNGQNNIRSNNCPPGYVPGRIMPRNKAGKFTV
jgi:hypothetical protein